MSSDKPVEEKVDIPLDRPVEEKVYMVTLKKGVDGAVFSGDMETEGGTLYIPDRVVAVHNSRPMSRTTEYWLTAAEQELVSNDERVLAAELNPKDAGFGIGLNTIVQQTGVFARNNNREATDLNWGLLRLINGENIVLNGIEVWGFYPDEITSTISFNATGRNVDLIIADENGAYFGHPEFKQLSGQDIDDGSPERIVQYDWFQHDLEVKGVPPTSSYIYNLNEPDVTNPAGGSHANHVMGTAGGNRQGWARDANLYNIQAVGASWTTYNNISYPLLFDYIRAFHANKPVNETTGIKNPTVVNNSWSFYNTAIFADITAVTYRGVRYTPPTGGSFTTSQLNGWGLLESDHPVRIAYIDADMEDAMDEGIIMIGAAGNNAWKHDVPGGPDWDNTYEKNNYTWSPKFYMRGSSPTAVDNNVNGTYNLPNICVGATDSIVHNSGSVALRKDKKASYSDCGPGVDIYAPGTAIMSSYNFYSYPSNYASFYTDLRNSGPMMFQGYSGVYSPNGFSIYSSGQVSEAKAAFTEDPENISQRIVTSGIDTLSQDTYGSGTCTSLGTNIPIDDTTGLTMSVIADSGDNDNGYWEVPIGFSVDFLGWPYDKVYIHTNSYLTFGAGLATLSPSRSHPALPKILVSAGGYPTSCQKIRYGLTGTSPNRIFRLVFEGHYHLYGTVNSPTVKYEYKFYEAIPAQIDLTIEQNARQCESFTAAKIQGTSMASPQVAGLVACLMETYPHYKQEDVKAYLLSKWAVADQLYDVLTTDNPTNYSDLQGSPNVHVKYHPERQLEGNVYPKKDYHLRPTTGVMYPRPKRTIRKRPPE